MVMYIVLEKTKLLRCISFALLFHAMLTEKLLQHTSDGYGLGYVSFAHYLQYLEVPL